MAEHKFEIKSGEDRKRLFLAFANSGYNVRVEEKKITIPEDFYPITKYYVVVTDN